MDDAAGGRPPCQQSVAALNRLGLTISRRAGGVVPARVVAGIQASLLLLLLVGARPSRHAGSVPRMVPREPRRGALRGDQRRDNLGYGARGVGTPHPYLIRR